jgi:hypothetical protein
MEKAELDKFQNGSFDKSLAHCACCFVNWYGLTGHDW